MEIVHPEDRARLLPLLARYAEQFAGLTLKNIFAGGSTPLTETVQYRVQNKSGQWHWLEGVGSIIENRIYALSRDITSDFNTQIPHKQIMAGLWKSSAEHKTSEEGVIQQLLNAVGPADGVSRACYNTFSDGDAPGGELACRMEWCAEGIKPSIGIKMPSLLVKHTLRNELFLLTPTAALENLPVPLRPMAAPLIAAISKACDLESVLAVPFHVASEMAGVLTFDVCVSASHKPEWTADMQDLVAEAVNIVSNLAARRRAEAELARHRQSLETLVDERTYQLSAANRELEDEILHHRQTLDAWKKSEEQRRKLEDRLKRAEKMEAVGILAGGVAHDLNNIRPRPRDPDLLLMDLPPESPLREAIRAIKDSGLKAAAVVNDLLTLARRGMMKCEPVNLNRVAEDFLRSPEYRRIAPDYPKVRIKQRSRKSPHTILGSQLHLSKALMNLLLNACEAITGGGDVTVATRNQHLSETLVRL